MGKEEVDLLPGPATKTSYTYLINHINSDKCYENEYRSASYVSALFDWFDAKMLEMAPFFEGIGAYHSNVVCTDC